MNDKLISLLNNYHPSDDAVEVVKSVSTVLIVGISGAGKNTIIHKLLDGGNYHFIVTHTTRKPRPGEQDGVHYHFIDKQTSLEMLESRRYIEANYYSENIYGTSVEEFRISARRHQVAVADIDVNGVRHFMEIAPESVRPIFLVPPDYDTWLIRWQQRYGDAYHEHREDLRRRLQTAIDELKVALDTDYYLFVVNDDLDRAVKELDTVASTGHQDPDRQAMGRQVTKDLLAAMEEARLT